VNGTKIFPPGTALLLRLKLQNHTYGRKALGKNGRGKFDINGVVADAVLQALPGKFVRRERQEDEAQLGNNKRRRNMITEKQIDETLAESFPASDPPSWTLGVESERRKKSPQGARLEPNKKASRRESKE
jgi:hypothetical protein